MAAMGAAAGGGGALGGFASGAVGGGGGGGSGGIFGKVLGMKRKTEAAQQDMAAAMAFNKQMKADARFLKSMGRIAKATTLREGRRVYGRQKTSYAKRGIALTGTVLDVLGETAFESMLAALRAESVYKNEARRKKMAGKAAMAKGAVGMAPSSILS